MNHPTEQAATSIRQRILRWLVWTIGSLMVLGIVIAAVIVGLLRASLPTLDGKSTVIGLHAPTRIERDSLGVPTITASNRHDMVYGLGFVHGQDRFFQMDMVRRLASGELAALLGPPGLEQDKWIRPRRLRQTAMKALAALPADQREMIQAYSEGVNAGLASLRTRPPEYWVLRVKPKPWKPEDSLLALLQMALTLTPPALDRPDSLMLRAIGPEAFAFFFPRGTDWDAALDGSTIPPAPLPGHEQLDFRHGWDPAGEPITKTWKEWVRAEKKVRLELGDGESDANQGSTLTVGSNGWAVDGATSGTGAALVASDMHFAYSIPGAHFRARLRWTEAGRLHDVIGLTLAGLPAVSTGSNGKVAWAPTAAELDLIDQVVLETDPKNPERYRVPAGWAEFERVTERLEVRGGPTVELPTCWTVWGMVYEKTGSGKPLQFDGLPVAQRYVFQSPEAIDLHFWDLLVATNTDEALQIAAESGSPVINLVVGDRAGKVGWTIAGRLPRRMGKVGGEITCWADGSNGWNGWLPAAEHPRVTSPAVSRVHSANHRHLGSPEYLALSNPNAAFGARAKQIRDSLAGLTNATPSDMVAIQLDDRALLLNRWRDLILATLREPKTQPALTNNVGELIDLVANWNGRATPDSVGYRLIRGVREATLEYIYEPLTARLTKLLGQPMTRYWNVAERPVWTLLERRPPHLLNPRFSSYDELLSTALRNVINELCSTHGGSLNRATWGERVNHPVHHIFSGSVPGLSRWLDADMEGCSGGEDMPRIHGEGGGGERLVVSPGHEDQGLFQMLGGQSGHFLSPYYRAGHDNWVHGKPGPLLPGPTKHTLTLVADKDQKPPTRVANSR